ncbi:MAG: flagellar basal-body rod protein FlgG [Deltaproteobacteria bacterium]|nr:flagellar basal-body rod protein FlgG [Deltaproteobacteria bacterium]
MLRAMSSAASGMSAQELRMDVIANNMANVNTTGFKRSRTEFQDVLYDNLKSAGALGGNGAQVPVGLQVGQGVRPVATLQEFTMGDLKQTGNPFDLAIEGAGFFQVAQADGELSYSRDGAFKIDAQGRLVTADGLLVEPALAVPPDAQQVTITADGTVSVTRPGRPDPVEVGQLELAVFPNPAGLLAKGHNLLQVTPASGAPILTAPAQNGAGRLTQGVLELANVRVVEEMIELIATQRAYETNSRVIKAADEMLGATANLK